MKYNQLGNTGTIRRLQRWLADVMSMAAQLPLSDKRTAHAAEADQTCQERMNQMIEKCAERKSLRRLKAENQMEWV